MKTFNMYFGQIKFLICFQIFKQELWFVVSLPFITEKDSFRRKYL
jgi:hypothetical protein